MRNALKAAAVAVICCAGVAFADPAATDQSTAATAANGNTVVVAEDNGNTNDPPMHHDGMRGGRGGPAQHENEEKPDDKDGDKGHGHEGSMEGMGDGMGGGPMMGMHGRMGGGMMMRMHGMMMRMHDQGEVGEMRPHGIMLGVETDSADPALSSQLNLPDGIGLVVENVLPHSAAQSAGVQKYDLLEKLDDQIVVNPEQVSVLIKMHKAGDKLTLTVIRHGKPTELTATLGAPAPTASEGRPGRPGRHGRPQSGKHNPGPTPDTSGAPAQPASPPQMEIPPRADESSTNSPAAVMQPTAAISDVLQQFADMFVD